MDNIVDFFAKPVVISPLAQARWSAFMQAVPMELEVYSFLLCCPGNPVRIENCYLPPQTVSGGHCRVSAEDVRRAGEVARRAGFRLAGSIHRHPFRSTSLSSIDDDLLDFMAQELASDLALQVRLTRNPIDLLVRTRSATSDGASGGRNAVISFAGTDVESEETVLASQICCLMWSPDGYFGKAARVVYDPVAGRKQSIHVLDSQIKLDDGISTVRVDLDRIEALAQRIVRRSHPAEMHSYREADWLYLQSWRGGYS